MFRVQTKMENKLYALPCHKGSDMPKCKVKLFWWTGEVSHG